MSSYILDYDEKKRVGTITSTNLDLVREHFSVEDQGAKFARRQRGYFIPTRKFVITPSGRFETGLTLDIYKKILEVDPDGTVQLTEKLKSNIKPGTKEPFEVNNTSDLPLRDYQSQVVEKSMKYGRGINMVATAGGKTLIMNTLITTLRKNNIAKTVVVILPTQLAKQTYDEFLSYNCDYSVTWWTGEHDPDRSSDVIIAGNKILLSEQQDVSWLFDADVLIVDEVHTLRRNNKINKIIKKFKTNKRFGFTGTLPEDVIDQWTIKGLIGPVIYEKTGHELRSENYITQAITNIIQVKYKNTPDYKPLSSPTDNYVKEVDFIINSDFRNKLISKIADKCDNNVLILVDRLQHGENLVKYITSISSKKVHYIKGEVESVEREQVKAIMEKNADVICIAISSIFSTGINIKNLHYIIFAAGGKAKVRIIQSIGRGLRLHESKDKLVIYDIFDDLRYGRKHYTKRVALYEKEKITYKVKELAEKQSNN